ncbi:oxalurate catabolism protein HpxZ [Dactylosporangium sp. NPDC000521]|uniref:oxalurate catabolism protein HpxZ n=1 Tax=Dactylosporangium sp. NPDC000521 TaxID=3363975 RepID=UPI0036B1FDA7
MRINRDDIVAEVEAAFVAYEKALVANDVTALAEAFWDSPAVVRFGVADHQTGAGELRDWRSAQPPLPPGRRLSGTKITTFGADLATVTTMFDYPGTGDRPGRQSQTWVRLPEGWRIVHAHVSHPRGDLSGSSDPTGSSDLSGDATGA